MFSVRLVKADHYMNTPIPGLDVRYSEFRGDEVKQVPVIRIFGSTGSGQKVCLHIHGVFPYIYIPYDGCIVKEKFIYQIASAIDKALNVSLGNSSSHTQHVYKVTHVSAIPFYGYHSKTHQFLKIYFYNPLIIKKASELLQNGVILGQVFQPHEAHIPFILQFCMDYNLHGMSFVNLASVRYRQGAIEGSNVKLSQLHNVPEEFLLPERVLRISTCSLEVDGVAADILNRQDISDQLTSNPGLKAIWDEEKERRRNENRNSQFTPQSSQTREPSPTASERFHLDRLKKRLCEVALLNENSKPVMEKSPSGEKPKPYPAPTPEGVDHLEASIILTHVNSLCHEKDPEESGENLNMQIEHEDEKTGTFPGHVDSSLDLESASSQSVLNSQCLSLVQILQDLIEDDSVLGSQHQDCGEEENEGECDSEDVLNQTLDCKELECGSASSHPLRPSDVGRGTEMGSSCETEEHFYLLQVDGANDMLREEEEEEDQQQLKQQEHSQQVEEAQLLSPELHCKSETHCPTEMIPEDLSLPTDLPLISEPEGVPENEYGVQPCDDLDYEANEVGTSLPLELPDNTDSFANEQSDCLLSLEQCNEEKSGYFSESAGADCTAEADKDTLSECLLLGDPWLTAQTIDSEKDEFLSENFPSSLKDSWIIDAENSAWIPTSEKYFSETSLISLSEVDDMSSQYETGDIAELAVEKSVEQNRTSTSETKRRLCSLIKSRTKAKEMQSSDKINSDLISVDDIVNCLKSDSCVSDYENSTSFGAIFQNSDYDQFLDESCIGEQNILNNVEGGSFLNENGLGSDLKTLGYDAIVENNKDRDYELFDEMCNRFQEGLEEEVIDKSSNNTSKPKKLPIVSYASRYEDETVTKQWPLDARDQVELGDHWSNGMTNYLIPGTKRRGRKPKWLKELEMTSGNKQAKVMQEKVKNNYELRKRVMNAHGKGRRSKLLNVQLKTNQNESGSANKVNESSISVIQNSKDVDNRTVRERLGILVRNSIGKKHSVKESSSEEKSPNILFTSRKTRQSLDTSLIIKNLAQCEQSVLPDKSNVMRVSRKEEKFCRSDGLVNEPHKPKERKECENNRFDINATCHTEPSLLVDGCDSGTVDTHKKSMNLNNVKEDEELAKKRIGQYVRQRLGILVESRSKLSSKSSGGTVALTSKVPCPACETSDNCSKVLKRHHRNRRKIVKPVDTDIKGCKMMNDCGGQTSFNSASVVKSEIFSTCEKSCAINTGVVEDTILPVETTLVVSNVKSTVENELQSSNVFIVEEKDATLESNKIPDTQCSQSLEDLLNLHSIQQCYVKLQKFDLNKLKSSKMVKSGVETTRSYKTVRRKISVVDLHKDESKYSDICNEIPQLVVDEQMSPEGINSEELLKTKQAEKEIDSHRFQSVLVANTVPGFVNSVYKHSNRLECAELNMKCMVPNSPKSVDKTVKKSGDIGSLKAVVQAESPRVADTLDTLPENPAHTIRHYVPGGGTYLDPIESRSIHLVEDYLREGNVVEVAKIPSIGFVQTTHNEQSEPILINANCIKNASVTSVKTNENIVCEHLEALTNSEIEFLSFTRGSLRKRTLQSDEKHWNKREKISEKSASIILSNVNQEEEFEVQDIKFASEDSGKMLEETTSTEFLIGDDKHFASSNKHLTNNSSKKIKENDTARISAGQQKVSNENVEDLSWNFSGTFPTSKVCPEKYLTNLQSELSHNEIKNIENKLTTFKTNSCNKQELQNTSENSSSKKIHSQKLINRNIEAVNLNSLKNSERKKRRASSSKSISLHKNKEFEEKLCETIPQEKISVKLRQVSSLNEKVDYNCDCTEERHSNKKCQYETLCDSECTVKLQCDLSPPEVKSTGDALSPCQAMTSNDIAMLQNTSENLLSIKTLSTSGSQRKGSVNTRNCTIKRNSLKHTKRIASVNKSVSLHKIDNDVKGKSNAVTTEESGFVNSQLRPFSSLYEKNYNSASPEIVHTKEKLQNQILCDESNMNPQSVLEHYTMKKAENKQPSIQTVPSNPTKELKSISENSFSRMTGSVSILRQKMRIGTGYHAVRVNSLKRSKRIALANKSISVHKNDDENLEVKPCVAAHKDDVSVNAQLRIISSLNEKVGNICDSAEEVHGKEIYRHQTLCDTERQCDLSYSGVQNTENTLPPCQAIAANDAGELRNASETVPTKNTLSAPGLYKKTDVNIKYAINLNSLKRSQRIASARKAISEPKNSAREDFGGKTTAAITEGNSVDVQRTPLSSLEVKVETCGITRGKQIKEIFQNKEKHDDECTTNSQSDLGNSEIQSSENKQTSTHTMPSNHSSELQNTSESSSSRKAQIVSGLHKKKHVITRYADKVTSLKHSERIAKSVAAHKHDVRKDFEGNSDTATCKEDVSGNVQLRENSLLNANVRCNITDEMHRKYVSNKKTLCDTMNLQSKLKHSETQNSESKQSPYQTMASPMLLRSTSENSSSGKKHTISGLHKKCVNAKYHAIKMSSLKRSKRIASAKKLISAHDNVAGADIKGKSRTVTPKENISGNIQLQEGSLLSENVSDHIDHTGLICRKKVCEKKTKYDNECTTNLPVNLKHPEKQKLKHKPQSVQTIPSSYTSEFQNTSRNSFSRKVHSVFGLHQHSQIETKYHSVKLNPLKHSRRLASANKLISVHKKDASKNLVRRPIAATSKLNGSAYINLRSVSLLNEEVDNCVSSGEMPKEKMNENKTDCDNECSTNLQSDLKYSEIQTTENKQIPVQTMPSNYTLRLQNTSKYSSNRRTHSIKELHQKSVIGTRHQVIKLNSLKRSKRKTAKSFSVQNNGPVNLEEMSAVTTAEDVSVNVRLRPVLSLSGKVADESESSGEIHSMETPDNKALWYESTMNLQSDLNRPETQNAENNHYQVMMSSDAADLQNNVACLKTYSLQNAHAGESCDIKLNPLQCSERKTVNKLTSLQCHNVVAEDFEGEHSAAKPADKTQLNTSVGDQYEGTWALHSVKMCKDIVERSNEPAKFVCELQDRSGTRTASLEMPLLECNSEKEKELKSTICENIVSKIRKLQRSIPCVDGANDSSNSDTSNDFESLSVVGQKHRNRVYKQVVKFDDLSNHVPTSSQICGVSIATKVEHNIQCLVEGSPVKTPKKRTYKPLDVLIKNTIQQRMLDVPSEKCKVGATKTGQEILMKYLSSVLGKPVTKQDVRKFQPRVTLKRLNPCIPRNKIIDLQRLKRRQLRDEICFCAERGRRKFTADAKCEKSEGVSLCHLHSEQPKEMICGCLHHGGDLAKVAYQCHTGTKEEQQQQISINHEKTVIRSVEVLNPAPFDFSVELISSSDSNERSPLLEADTHEGDPGAYSDFCRSPQECIRELDVAKSRDICPSRTIPISSANEFEAEKAGMSNTHECCEEISTLRCEPHSLMIKDNERKNLLQMSVRKSLLSPSNISTNLELNVSLPAKLCYTQRSGGSVMNITSTIIIIPKKVPPSRKQVIQNLSNLNLPQQKFLKPFFSNASDVVERKEIGYKDLKIHSHSIKELDLFESLLPGIKGLKTFKDKAIQNLWEQSQSSGGNAEIIFNHGNLKAALGGQRETIIMPSSCAPSVNEVKLWARARLIYKESTKKRKNCEVKDTTKQKFLELKDDNKLANMAVPVTSLCTSIQEFSESNQARASSYVQLPEVACQPLHNQVSTSKCTIKAEDCLKGNCNLSDDDMYREGKTKQESFQDSTCSVPDAASSSFSIQKATDHSNTSVGNLLAQTQFRQQLATPEAGKSHDSLGFKMSCENLQDCRAVVEPQYLTILAIELHIQTRGDLQPDPAHDPVCAIFYCVQNDVPEESLVPNLLTGMIVVRDSTCQRISLIHNIEINCKTCYVSDEKSLMEEVIHLVQLWDPDILAGYEVEMQSWGYLFERAFVLEMNLCPLVSRIPGARQGNKLSLDESVMELSEEFSLLGRIMLNVWRLMRHEVALQSYTFENVSFHVLHERIPLVSFKTLTQWWGHRTRYFWGRVADHYLLRVQGLMRILEQLDLINRTSELARIFGIQFYEVLSRGSQFRVESMMLRLAKPLNYVPVSPSIQQRARMRAPECLQLIMEPESQLYVDPVIVLDFQSLYPSMIIAYNYCFSTCLGRVEHLGQTSPFEFGSSHLRVPLEHIKHLLENLNISPSGVAFVNATERKGILPRMLKEILETRLMVKKSMKEHKDDKTLQRVLHSRQLGLKLIANVTYGYTAANFSGRMSCVEVADSVVSKGRETLERAIHLVESTSRWDARVVYGDTDSLFVLVPGRSREDAFVIGAEIAEAVTQDNPNPVKLKLEKVYQPCILQTKKRYVGYMYENASQKEPVYDAKGIETVRRDGCPAVAKVLEKSLRLLFETKDVSMVKAYVQRKFSQLLEGQMSIQDLIFAREYRGNGGYKPGACVPALELTKRWLNVDPRAEPRVSERVPYIVISGAPNVPLIQLVRSPHELLAEPGLKVHAHYYVSRVLCPPLARCFSLLGVDVLSWYTDLPRRIVLSLPKSVPVREHKKLTISQYFSTSNCPVCHQICQMGICSDCQKQPQITAVILAEKLHEWECHYYNLEKICQSCCQHFDKIECISLDCPVMYNRIQARHTMLQETFIRNLLENIQQSTLE